MSDNIAEPVEPIDKLQCLDALMRLLGRPTSRREFVSDPWKALAGAGIPRDQAPGEFETFVDAIADYSDEELKLLGSFGAHVFELMEPQRWLF